MRYGVKWLKYILFAGFLLVNLLGHSQRTEIDSIKNILVDKKFSSTNYHKDTSYIDALNSLAHQYITINVDSTFSLAQKALSLSEAIDYNHGIGNSLLYTGIYYSEKGKSESAFEIYKCALKVARTGDNLNLLFRIKSNIGIEYKLRGEYDQAIKVYLENLELAKAQGNQNNISQANTNIGVLFNIQGEYAVALLYYKEALKASNKSKNNYSIGTDMINITDANIGLGRIEEAQTLIAETKDFLKKHNYVFLLGELYRYEGQLFNQLKQYDLAYGALQKSIELLNESNNSQINYAIRYQAMADVLLKQEEYGKAFHFGKLAYKTAKKTNDLRAITLTSGTLYNYYKSMGSVAETFMYLEEFKKYSDSLFNSQNKNGLLMLKAKSDFEKKQSELEAENEKIVLKKQNKITTSLWVIVILIATLIPLYHKHRKLGQLNSKITEKSKLLEKREKELIKSNNTKDKLFSIIGHDLKGPIDSFRLLLGMHQKKEVSDKEFLKYSPKLNKDVGSVFFTLTNLLNWGKSQMKGEVVQKRNFAVKPLVSDVIDFLEYTSVSKQLKLVNETEGEVEVYADRNQIDVVIRNILSNAIKFTPAKGTIKVVSKDFENKYRISIMDNGIGMGLNTAERALDPNETYTTYGTANEKGTGLGLILCKELIEKNKGKIWVESTLGKGSTFHMLLPKAKGASEILKTS